MCTHDCKLKATPVPMFLQLEMLYQCNANCIFCYNPSRLEPVSDDHIWKMLQSIRKAQIPLVQLTGGEVSLLKNLNSYIDYLYETTNVCIVTNGLIKRDLSPNLGFIYVSVHGKKDIHEKLVRVPDSYEKVIKTIGGYLDEGRMVCTETVINKLNYNTIHETILDLDALGVDTIFINRYEPGGMGAALHKQLMPSISEFNTSIRKILEIRSSLQSKLAFCVAVPFCLSKEIAESGLAEDCFAGVTLAAVNPKGGLRVCNQSERVYGNILETDIHAIWNCAEINCEYRDIKEWITEPCKSCPIVDRCCAGCRVDSTSGEKYSIDYQIRDPEAEILSKEELEAIFLTPDQDNEDGDEIDLLPSHTKVRLAPFSRINQEYINIYNDYKVFTRNNYVDTNQLGVEILKLVPRSGISIQQLSGEINTRRKIESQESIGAFVSYMVDRGFLEVE